MECRPGGALTFPPFLLSTASWSRERSTDAATLPLAGFLRPVFAVDLPFRPAPLFSPLVILSWGIGWSIGLFYVSRSVLRVLSSLNVLPDCLLCRFGFTNAWVS